MLNKAAFVSAIAACVLLTGCGGNEIEKVVRENIKGLQEQNIVKVMDTIDKQSPVYESTKAQVTRMIQDYNLDFKIESMDIIEQPGNDKQEAKPKTEEAEDALGVTEELAGMITEGERDKVLEEKRRKEAEEKRRPLVARVKVVQVTRHKQNNETRFADNRVLVVHTLHKYPTDEKPVWKIHNSDVRSVSYLPAE